MMDSLKKVSEWQNLRQFIFVQLALKPQNSLNNFFHVCCITPQQCKNTLMRKK